MNSSAVLRPIASILLLELCKMDEQGFRSCFPRKVTASSLLNVQTYTPYHTTSFLAPNVAATTARARDEEAAGARAAPARAGGEEAHRGDGATPQRGGGAPEGRGGEEAGRPRTGTSRDRREGEKKKNPGRRQDFEEQSPFF